MSAFVDAMLARLATPDGLRQFVFPAGDAARDRIRALFAEVYHLPNGAVLDVVDVDVLASSCQRPLFPSRHRRGSWLQTIPAQTRGDFTVEGSDRERPYWVDVSADLNVTAVLLVDPGEIESVRFGEVGEWYLRGEVRLKPAPPPDPEHLLHQRFPLNVAVLVRDSVDLSAALRDVRMVLAAAELEDAPPAHGDAAELRAPCAPLLVFPLSAVAGSGLTQEQIVEFFASQHTLAVFEQP